MLATVLSKSDRFVCDSAHLVRLYADVRSRNTTNMATQSVMALSSLRREPLRPRCERVQPVLDGVLRVGAH